MILIVRENEIIAVAHPDRDGEILTQLGLAQTIRQGGVVEPDPPWQRAIYWAVRALLGWLRPVREWTRRWPGPWRVRMPDRSQLGPFLDREVAVRAEEETLAQMLGEMLGDRLR